LTQVFFYHGAADKLAAACALISGAYAKGKALQIYAPEKSLADSVDRALWTQAQLSFIPHCRADSPLATETPIVIAEHAEQLNPGERLLNLSLDIPTAFQQFNSLIEVVGQDEAERDAGRERVRHYRAAGCDVRFYDLSQR